MRTSTTWPRCRSSRPSASGKSRARSGATQCFDKIRRPLRVEHAVRFDKLLGTVKVSPKATLTAEEFEWGTIRRPSDLDDQPDLVAGERSRRAILSGQFRPRP